MIVCGIDPGPEDATWVIWDGEDVTFVFEGSNGALYFSDVHLFAIEDFVTYRPLDRNGRETIKNIGAIRYWIKTHSKDIIEIPRADVLRYFTGGTKGGDVALRAAIYDRFGGSRQAAIGTKKNPGPLYGLSGSHMLAALAVAIMAYETIGGGNNQPKGILHGEK